MSDESEVIFEQRGPLGLITLNKPKALNALTMNMIELLAPKLDAWAHDDTVRAVVIRGEGEKAFCAGGDIRDMYLQRGSDFGARYYAAEYKLNVQIHKYAKPFVALMDGVTMGGGAGVGVHGSHRVLSERTTFAMPETGIGLFPDIGAGWFLNRCPGEIGMFLALTGYRMRAADTIYAQIGDACVPSGNIDALVDALEKADTLDRASIGEVIEDFTENPGEPPLAAQRAAIDRCFSADSVEEIIARLEAEGGEWAETQLKALRRMSPTSLKVTFRQIREAKPLAAIEDVMRMEYRLACHFYAGHDLFEGIRAVVIDKDHAPKWDPDTLDRVGEDAVAGYFEPVPGEPDFRNPTA